jgi:hypothetical protein
VPKGTENLEEKAKKVIAPQIVGEWFLGREK